MYLTKNTLAFIKPQNERILRAMSECMRGSGRARRSPAKKSCHWGHGGKFEGSSSWIGLIVLMAICIEACGLSI